MRQEEAVDLIRDAVAPRDRAWLDVGAGSGTFAFALAELLGPEGVVTAVDVDEAAVQRVAAHAARLPEGQARVRALVADATRLASHPVLVRERFDGVVLANVLHSFATPEGVLATVPDLLAPGGRVLVIEYETEGADAWVPHPIPAARLVGVARTARMGTPTILATRPSRYRGSIYAAVLVPDDAERSSAVGSTDRGRFGDDRARLALAELRQERDRWVELLGAASTEQLHAARTAKGWSIRDFVAHLAGWQQVSNARLAAAIDGAEPRYPTWLGDGHPEDETRLQTYNDTIHASNHGVAWPDVERAWRAGFDALLRRAEAIASDHMLEPGRYPWLGEHALVEVLEGSLEHHREHRSKLFPDASG